MRYVESGIEHLLQPVGIDEFFNEYWEQQPLHVERSNGNYFSSILAVADIETLLSTRDLYFPTVQLTQSGKHIDPALYCDENHKIKPYRLIQQHREGATIVMSQGHRLLDKLGEYCRQLHCALQWRCQANVYLSPNGKQGFKSHYDTHDVFVLQVSGRKTFSFYSPGVELPFSEEAYDPQQNLNAEKDDEITLAAGDTLYIPRGMVHDARAHDDNPSLHITVGVYPVVVRDLLQEIIQVAAEQHVDYRKSLPHRYWRNTESGVNSIEASMQGLLGKVFSADNLAEAMSRLRDEAAISGAQDCSELLYSSLQSIDKTNARFAVVDHRVLNVERRDQIVRLRLLGQVVEFPEPLSSAVEWLLGQEFFDAESLPGLTTEQKHTLINHLLRERIIRLADIE